MWRALLVTLVISLVLAYLLFNWYSVFSAQYPSIEEQVTVIVSTGSFAVDDWTGALDQAAHRYTIQKYCHDKGYDYEAPAGPGDNGHCLYNQVTCQADSNPHFVPGCIHVTGSSDPTAGVDGNGKPCNFYQRPYLEWHTLPNGSGMCMSSSFPPSFIENVCEAKGLGSWYQGTPICDSSGYCQLNPDDLPSCTLTPAYCDSMGLDYLSDGGKGDCNLSDWQNVVEGLIGKTVTRTVKRNTEAMIRECGSDFFSANCALSIGTELTTLDQIGINTVDTEFAGYLNSMKTACSGDIYSSLDNFAGCAGSLFPGFYIGEQAEKFADNMLNGALGWIPGYPKGLIQKLNGYVYKYGAVALNAVYHAGINAVVGAFDIAGDAAYYALDAVGLGVAGKYIQGVIGNILVYGEKVASVIATVARQAIAGAIDLFVNTIAPAAYHVFHAICDAVLHPKEFFTNLVNKVGQEFTQFFTDPEQFISDAITGLASIGGKILDAAKAVINKLRDIASAVAGALQQLAQTLLNIAQKIEDEFKDIGNDIVGGIEKVGHFFSHLF